MMIDRVKMLVESPHFFASEIFGLRMTEAHTAMMDHISGDHNRSLLLCARGLGKSLVLQAYICWRILRNPNDRCIIVSDSDNKARSFMRAVKQTMESQNVRDVWGDVRGAVWTDHEISLVGKTTISAEPTLQCLGAGSGACTGRHCDLLIVDDLVSFDSTRSELQRTRTRDWYLTSLLPTVMMDGAIIVAGTRYHFMDIYHTLIDGLKYDTLILPPIKPDGTAQCEFLQPIDDVLNDKGVVVKRGLKTIRHDLGSVVYALQYENDVALLLDGNIINKSWIKYYSQIPKLESIVISCDPAISKSDTADSTAIIIGGRAPDGTIYIKDYVNAKMSFNETIEKLVSLVATYAPVEVRIEQVGFSEAFITELKREVPTTLIKGVKPIGDKESRLREVSPIMENGLVRFAESQGVIVSQMLLFPGDDHDDLVDAMSLFLSYYRKPSEGCIIF